MKIYIGADHAAFNEKNLLRDYLSQKYEVIDVGTHTSESTSYSEWGIATIKKMKADSKSVGILLCGSGIGISITANRFKGIRAALCRDVEDAKMSRLHNDANVLCLGARRTSLEDLKKIADVFLTTTFEGGRHQTRIDLFNDLGE